MNVLDFGCGNRKKEVRDAIVIGIDRYPFPCVDVVHDLNRFPYPFDDNEFDMIICDDILEHLDDVIQVMNELHRITKNHGIIKISVPHYTSDNYPTDLTHKHPMSSRSFFGFDSTFKKFHRYNPEIDFRVRKNIIGFTEIMKSGNPHGRNLFFGIQWLVNLNKFTQRIYEKFFAFIVPATELYFELEVVKDENRNRR